MKLEIKSVTKQYGKKLSLNDVNIVFKKGVTGLLGPNGAGKSTLMRLMATIDKPTSGSITWNGKDIVKEPKEIRSVLGYLPQDFGIYPNLNPVEFLEYMATIKGLPRKASKIQINKLLEVLNLGDTKKRLLGGFSGGMKQRIGIAQALLNNPDILIIDEPTVGLDPEERIAFRNLLSSIASDRIIILSTHIVSDIEAIAPKITVLSQGTLIFNDTPETLLEKVGGKVWSCTVSAEKFMEMQQKYMVSNSMQCSDGIMARIISNNQPSLESIQVHPNLEDAYLSITSKGKEG